MGATKKRRQTKHRGNAAGMVESRGRTGARVASNATGGGSDARGARVPKPPTWNRAVVKALLPVVLLAALMLFTQKNVPVTGKIVFIGLAFVAYIPLSYFVDRWAWNRYLKQTGKR